MFYFVNVLGSVSIEKRCYEVATAMVKFWEIKENINQGLSFYIALQVVNYINSQFVCLFFNAFAIPLMYFVV